MELLVLFYILVLFQFFFQDYLGTFIAIKMSFFVSTVKYNRHVLLLTFNRSLFSMHNLQISTSFIVKVHVLYIIHSI